MRSPPLRAGRGILLLSPLLFVGCLFYTPAMVREIDPTVSGLVESPVRAHLLAPDRKLARALRVRHEAHDIALLAANARDVVDRAVRVGFRRDGAGICGVSENHLPALFQSLDDIRLRVVVAVAVRDRHPEPLAPAAVRRERRVGLFHLHEYLFALELDAAVAEHRPWQQARLEEHLKAVADAEHRTARFRE